jgi:hypothetical protein
MGEDDRGFTVRDERGVKNEGEPAENRTDEPSAEDARPGGTEGPKGLPPLDFSGFVFGLGQMALVHMGDLPEPLTGQRAKDLEQARHTIDILDLLEQKTRGNLTPDEAELLRHLLSDLKLRYVRQAV